MRDFASKFYLSAAWKRTREAYFRSRCGICERCGAAGKIVHHKTYLTPNNIGNPKVTLSFDNLELLCQDCHNKEHAPKPKVRYRIDADGNLSPPEDGNIGDT